MDTLIAVLAVARVAYLIASEEGPFSVAARLRGLFDPDQRTWVGRGLNCPLCISFWLALLLALALNQSLLWGLGVAGGVMVIFLAVRV